MSISTTLFLFPVVMLIYFAVPTLLLSILQLFLCRKELKWGRILPIFSAVVSVLYPLFFLLYAAGGIGIIPALLWAAETLVLLNIPTFIYWLIYRSAKQKHAREDLNRTRIDDLE